MLAGLSKVLKTGKNLQILDMGEGGIERKVYELTSMIVTCRKTKVMQRFPYQGVETIFPIRIDNSLICITIGFPGFGDFP